MQDIREVRFKQQGILLDSKRGKYYKIKDNELAMLESNKQYFFNTRPFYVMQGKGEIDIESLPYQKPKFDLIKLENLDYYLQHNVHKSIDYAEQMQIESFCKIFEFNENAKEAKLFSKEYQTLEKMLFAMQEYDFYKMTKF